MFNNSSKHLYILLFSIFILLCGCLSPTYDANVVKVLDGDSINVIHDGKEMRVRLAEIDAPERGQAYWKKSKKALESYVKNKKVEIEEFDVDQYGRLVGHVYVENVWVNAELVKNGYAYVYTQYAVSQKLFKLENNAENNKIGLWQLAKDKRIKPWVWRNKH